MSEPTKENMERALNLLVFVDATAFQIALALDEAEQRGHDRALTMPNGDVAKDNFLYRGTCNQCGSVSHGSVEGVYRCMGCTAKNTLKMAKLEPRRTNKRLGSWLT